MPLVTSFASAAVRGLRSRGGYTPTGIDNIPTMTSGTTSGVTIAASSQYSGTYPGWKVGDKNLTGNERWATTSSAPPHWVSFDFGAPITVASYTIAPLLNTNYFPTAFVLQGSTTGAFSGEQVTLDTQSGLTSGWTSAGYRTFTLASPSILTYRYWRLYVTAVIGANADLVIYEIQLKA